MVYERFSDNFMDDCGHILCGLARMARRHLRPKNVDKWGAKQKEGILTV